jgi:hypothetical protein
VVAEGLLRVLLSDYLAWDKEEATTSWDLLHSLTD